MPTTVVVPVGAGQTYTTLNSFVTSYASKNLVSDDTIVKVELAAGESGLATAPMTFSSSAWTTDATRYIWITAASGGEYRGTGTWDTSKSYLDITGITGANGGIVFNDFLKVSDIQVKGTPSAAISNTHVFYNNAAVCQFTIENCLVIYDLDAANASRQEGPIMELRGANPGAVIRNNIFIVNSNGSTGTVDAIRISNTYGVTHTLHNNTIILRDKAAGAAQLLVMSNNDTIDCDNNYLHAEGGTVDIYHAIGSPTFNIGAGDSTSNAEATTVALQNVAYDASTFESVTPGSEDLTPAAGSALVDAGTDLTASGVTTDIAGTARPQGAAFDIGAVESAQVTGDGVAKILQALPFVASGLLDADDGEVIKTITNLKGTSLSWVVDQTIGGSGSFSAVQIDIEYSLDAGQTWLADSAAISTTTTTAEVSGSDTAVSTYARIVATTLTASSGTPTYSCAGLLLVT